MTEATPPSGAGHMVSPGTLFHGTLQVISSIKAGGMGAVYEVLHTPTQRRRALKLMHPSLVGNAEMRERFEREARVAAFIDSEHIVETIDAGVDEDTGVPFILMELLKGRELAELLKERKRLSPPEVIAVVCQVVRALDLTHAAGVVHRDLKPDNLFLSLRDDGSVRVKILDFGVAKIVANNSGADTTATVGTPLYMAPEQVHGGDGLSGRTDHYALAQVVYTLLVGKAYWSEDRAAAGALMPFLVRMLTGPREAASERAARRGATLPEGFDDWFARATARDPKDRFENGGTFIDGLADALAVKGLLNAGVSGEIEALAGLAAPLLKTIRSERQSAADLTPPSLPQPSPSHPSLDVATGGADELPTVAASTHGAITSDATEPPPSRKPVTIAIGVVAAMVLLGGLLMAVISGEGSESRSPAAAPPSGAELAAPSGAAGVPSAGVPSAAATSNGDAAAVAASGAPSASVATTGANAAAASARKTKRGAARPPTAVPRAVAPTSKRPAGKPVSGDPLDTY